MAPIAFYYIRLNASDEFPVRVVFVAYEILVLVLCEDRVAKIMEV